MNHIQILNIKKKHSFFFQKLSKVSSKVTNVTDGASTIFVKGSPKTVMYLSKIATKNNQIPEDIFFYEVNFK